MSRKGIFNSIYWGKFGVERQLTPLNAVCGCSDSRCKYSPTAVLSRGKQLDKIENSSECIQSYFGVSMAATCDEELFLLSFIIRPVTLHKLPKAFYFLFFCQNFPKKTVKRFSQ